MARKTKTRRPQSLQVVNPDCAGIDIGKVRYWVAVSPEGAADPMREFGGFMRDLVALGEWGAG